MNPAVLVLVLSAALLHASWNGMLKGALDRRWMTIVMQLTAMAAAGGVALFLPLPAPHSWPWLVAGASLHIGYSVFLVRAISLGELGEIYPISRGASPVMVTAVAALAAHDRLTWPQILGIAVVSAAIVSLRRGRARTLPLTALLAALGTAAFTAGYTVVDGMGARQSGQVASYITWLWVLDGVFVGGWFLLARRPESDQRPSLKQTLMAALAGLISMAAYSAVIWATTLGALGAVSALRETSVLFAALIGALFLGERLTLGRVAACVAIAAGALFIALS